MDTLASNCYATIISTRYDWHKIVMLLCCNLSAFNDCYAATALLHESCHYDGEWSKKNYMSCLMY